MGRIRAAIVAIGTEVTEGQIVNRNAAWLSGQLCDIGFDIVEHRAVPDEHVKMAAAVLDLMQKCEILFVTGGLGPTQDDFTRDVIADIFSRPLEFHQESWDEVVEKLSARGVPVGKSQRQQCFFPFGSEILKNSAGTANGFALTEMGSSGPVDIFVLPGPPAEIAAIWQNWILDRLSSRIPAAARMRLKIWRCLGKGESEIAELTEKALGALDFTLGYRAHMPYVEVKVWGTDEQWQRHNNYILEFEKTIAPWLVNRDKQDLIDSLIFVAQKQSVEIWDEATGGILAERVAVYLRERKKEDLNLQLRLHTLWNAPRVSLSMPSARIAMHIAAEGDLWNVSLGQAHAFEVTAVRPAYKYTLASERGRKYIAEQSLFLLNSWFEQQGLLK